MIVPKYYEDLKVLHMEKRAMLILAASVSAACILDENKGIASGLRHETEIFTKW